MALKRIAIPHTARTAQGVALPGATMTVAVYGGPFAPPYAHNDPAAVYLGDDVLTQPIKARADGTFPGYVNPGRYTVAITHGGSTESHEWNALAAGPDDWRAISLDGGLTSFQNSWGFLTFGTWPRYRKTSEGLVMVQGAVTGGTLGAAAFTLPAGYRPTGGQRIFPEISPFTVAQRVDVTTAGAVIPALNSNAAHYLNFTFAI